MTRPALIHPVWCGLVDAGCTVLADVALPFDGSMHRSRPVELDLSGSFDWPASGARVATVYLTQVAARWATNTYLVVRVAGTEFSLPVNAARTAVAELGRLLDRTVTPKHEPENIPPAEFATRQGAPATASDDTCPVCGVAYGTEWLGQDDFGLSHWSHTYVHPEAEADCEPGPCGLRWTTRVRRPNNGVEFVRLVHAAENAWETDCVFCGDVAIGYRTEADAQAAADQHAADHEAAMKESK